MPYSIIITFSISQIVQTFFLAWLWYKMHKNSPLLLEYKTEYPLATAPYKIE